jgi:hypothetical protein
VAAQSIASGGSHVESDGPRRRGSDIRILKRKALAALIVGTMTIREPTAVAAAMTCTFSRVAWPG